MKQAKTHKYKFPRVENKSYWCQKYTGTKINPKSSQVWRRAKWIKYPSGFEAYSKDRKRDKEIWDKKCWNYS